MTLHSTSVVGGLLFIALGVAFLAFDGTSALPSVLSADSEFVLEERLSGLGAAVSDRLVLLVLAAVAASAALLVLLRPTRRRDPRPSPEEEPSAHG